ncbi:MAG: peptidyl-prolyl cis-trans isomerase [Candidatus Omnitrophota bacterium]|nr:peptidyl-prolyl cis-trans isomerase [Candidatus Omnitrophota bacterium]MBU1929194.1 peptidyl-prolyl cis-trans isomerase [Candidatus Omnitrophota bacterium]
MPKSIRIFIISVILPTTYCLLSTVPAFAADKIIAIVNNEAITQKELDDFLNFTRMRLNENYDKIKIEEKMDSIKKDLLDRLIEDRLLVQEAKKEEIKIDPQRIKDKINDTIKQYNNQAEYEIALRQQGLVQADIETKVKEQLLMFALIESKVRSKIIIEPEEVTDFYYKNIEEFKLSEQREFEYIVFSDESSAIEAIDKLKTESDWSEAADKYSFKVNKHSGRKNSELRKEIDEVVFNLKAGAVSAPVKIDDSFYIFKVGNITLYRQQSLFEVQDRVYRILWERKMQEGMVKLIDDLRKKAYIKIF